MCSTDVYCSKQTGGSSTKRNHHPSFLRFWNWAEENCRCSKICGGAENVVKTETQQTFVNGLLGFITLKHLLSAGSCCVLLTIIAWVAHRYGQLYLHCSLIYFWVSFQLFLHSDQPLWGEIIPFSGVCQSELHYPRRRRWWLHARLTDCFDVQPTTTSGNIITQSIIFSFSIQLTPSRCIFASSAATSRWRICMSVIAAFASFSSLAFCRAGLCR